MTDSPITPREAKLSAELHDALQANANLGTELGALKKEHDEVLASARVTQENRDLTRGRVAELEARSPERFVQICKLGAHGTAYDGPTSHRAYTYAEQPGNQLAWRLGGVLAAAAREGGGDFIDTGLGLLKHLQEKGLGVFEIDPAAQQPAAVDEQDLFESKFPMPAHCIRFTGGYAASSFNAWAAHAFIEQWSGWKARAALAGGAQ